jgi:hypothetical protein
MNVSDIQDIGHYRVKRFIAEGGMAWVFEVVDTRYEGFEVVRALKMLKPDFAMGDEFERFKTEASVLAGIDHPNLVTIYDPPDRKDEATGCFYYTMAFIEGPTLATYQSQRGELTELETLQIFEELISGLAELHRRKIVHRDIKPANVLIGTDGRPRLADLGIARLQETTSRTKTGFALGTVNYMSPEQARGKSVAEPSDVFAIGITLYEALTGRHVYDDMDDVDSTNSHDVLGYLAAMARSGTEIEIDYQAARISPPIAKLIKKACRPDPEDRYEDASEMLEALREVRREMEVGPATGPSPRMLWIAGGSLLALLVAAGVGWFVFDQRETERVRGILDEASALETGLVAIIERGANLDPQPETDLAEALRTSRAASQRYLTDAKEYFDSERRESAEDNAVKAQAGIRGICERLVAEHVAPLSTERMAAAGASIEGLRLDGAEQHFQQEFASLAAMVPAAAAIGEGCNGVNAHLDRIELAAVIETQAAALDVKLAVLLPTLAEESRDRALGARTRAEADRVDEPPYQSALEAAAQAMKQGDGLRDDGHSSEARGKYQEAVAQFELASAIAPAARARAKTLAVERTLEAKGQPPSVSTSRILAAAHDLYSDGKWQEAMAEFQTAEARMVEDLDRGAATAEATAMRDRASRIRTEAITAGAERSATEELSQADESMTAGNTALTNDTISESLTHFQKAERLFATARNASARSLEDANEAGRAADRDLERCEGLKAPGARGACDEALSAAERGRRAVASKDAPEALNAFGDVARHVQRARAENESWAVANQTPPSIVSQSPSKSAISTRRNQRIEFSVYAEDANDDPIQYEWSFEGNRLPETGPTLRFPPQRSGTLQVAALDTNGRSSPARWRVDLVNAPPVVSVDPSAESVRFSAGGFRTFRAEIEDPDGDAVDSVWKLDGAQVATGTSYRFTSEKQGRYELEIVATDAGGERTVVRRNIEVTKRTERPADPSVARREPERVRQPEPERQPEPTPRERKEQRIAAVTPTPLPSSNRTVQGVTMPTDVAISQEWREGVIIALGRYRQALVAKDMSQLQNIWIGLKMNPQQGQRWIPRYSGLFNSDKPLAVDLAVRTAYSSGNGEVTLTLAQTEQRGDSRARTRDYDVELLKRGTTNEWQITEINKAQ